MSSEAVRYGPVQGVRVGRYPWAINTTCLCFRLGDTLIDTGPANQSRQVLAFAREKQLRQILLTHHHEDHCGNAAYLQRKLKIPVFAPGKAVPLLADGFPVQRYRRWVWGRPERLQAPELPPEVETGAGWRLRPIPTPGHSADMTCFLEPLQGWLFAGDLFVSARPRYLRADENLDESIDSLRAILEFKFDVLMCGHRGIVRGGRVLLTEKLAYLEQLRAEVRQRRQLGEPVAQITLDLLGREDFLSWFSGGHFSKQNLVRACLAGEQQ